VCWALQAAIALHRLSTGAPGICEGDCAVAQSETVLSSHTQPHRCFHQNDADHCRPHGNFEKGYLHNSNQAAGAEYTASGRMDGNSRLSVCAWGSAIGLVYASPCVLWWEPALQYCLPSGSYPRKRRIIIVLFGTNRRSYPRERRIIIVLFGTNRRHLLQDVSIPRTHLLTT
jgi:hypothetical protein